MGIRIISPFDRNESESQKLERREETERKKRHPEKRQKIAHPSHLFTLRDKSNENGDLGSQYGY